MSESCQFCKQLRDQIETNAYHTEQARKNGRLHIDHYSDKYVAAYSHESYMDGKFIGHTTTYFDRLNFCPICGTDLRSLLSKK